MSIQLSTNGVLFIVNRYFAVETGETIGRLEWKEDVIQETGADFLLMAVSCSVICLAFFR